MKINKIFSIFIFLIISCCTLEPRYNKPSNELPFVETENPSKKKINIISWQEFFKSPDLQRVIQLALDKNHDLKIAAINVNIAQESYGVARSNLMPTISATATEIRQGVPSGFASFTPRRQYRANLALASYEVDFFGRIRSLKKSAFEDYLANEEAKNVVKISLISEVVNAYVQFLVDRQNLDLEKENFEAQNKKFQYIEMRYNNGIDSQTALLNAQAALENSKSSYESYKKIFEQDKNNLMLLTATFDDSALPKVATIDDVEIAENLLDFIPSQSLLSRPDIKQAEHNLKSANANIGAARAAFFPSITLTGTYGYGSRDLNNLLDSKSWVFTPQINLPIFTGGRNIANLELANLRKKAEIVNYEKAIQNAFKDALDQLAEREYISKQLQSFDKILQARKKNNAISSTKYNLGINSSYTMLDDKIAFLNAKQNRDNVKKEYIANLVALYKVLGGGADVEIIEE